MSLPNPLWAPFLYNGSISRLGFSFLTCCLYHSEKQKGTAKTDRYYTLNGGKLFELRVINTLSFSPVLCSPCPYTTCRLPNNPCDTNEHQCRRPSQVLE